MIDKRDKTTQHTNLPSYMIAHRLKEGGIDTDFCKFLLLRDSLFNMQAEKVGCSLRHSGEHSAWESELSHACLQPSVYDSVIRV